MENIFGYIGLSDRVSEVESGLYIDALPDISLDMLSKITDSQDADITDLWTRIEKRGVFKFRTLFLNAINKCHHLKSIDICECLIDENIDVLGVSLWYFLGSEVLFERVNSQRLNKYTTLDRAKAKELMGTYLDIFQTELTVAVNSIDIHLSACTEDEEIEENNIISTHYIQP